MYSNSITVLSVLFISHYNIIKRKNNTVKMSVGKYVTSITSVKKKNTLFTYLQILFKTTIKIHFSLISIFYDSLIM
jgi:hypothetical protein